MCVTGVYSTLQEQQEMTVREYANWGASACNDGGNPVLSHIIPNDWEGN